MSRDRRTTLKQFALAATAVGLPGCTSPSQSDSTTSASPTNTDTSPSRTDTGTGTGTGTTTTTDPQTTNATDSPERGDYTVGMYTDLYFDPVGLHVEPGETVSFELVSGAHSATAYDPSNANALDRRIPDGAPAWDTGTFGEVGAFRNVTFETPGTHDYYCIPHKMVGMVGRIVVGDPGGPATESSNPDLELPASERIVEEGSVAWADWESNV